MYNLTFDTPYDREIVRKLRNFRDVQEKYYIPTTIEPEHIVHHYDPVTITGGARAGLPADLFEPRYTLNRHQMVEGRHPIHGGSLIRPVIRREVKEESESSESEGEGEPKKKLRALQKIGGKKPKKKSSATEKKERKPSNRLLKIFN